MSLYQEVYHGESFSEADFYEAVRYIFQPEVGEATTEEIDSFLIETVSQMTPEEIESFWGKIGNFAKKVGSGALNIVSKAAPVVGTAVGAAYGVPQLGRMVGGLAGNLAGAGAKALDRVPDFRTQPRRRRRTSPSRSNRNPELTRAWNQTRNTLGRVGRHALHAANDYAARNPVRRYGARENSSEVLSEMINNPIFEAALLRNTYAETNSENISVNDFNFLETVEAINYLTEGIISEYYDKGLVEDDEYFVDEYGELVVNYPEERVERIESFIENY